MQLKSVASIAAAIIGTSAAATAHAGTVQTTMPVTALNISSCAVVALPLAFGSLTQIGGTAVDSQTTVTVTCTPGVGYNVGLDDGAHAAGGTRQLQAVIGSSVIPYTIYSDAARTTQWGTTIGSDTVARTATLLPAALTVYGRIPANTPLATAGAYTDLVTVTVTF